MKLTNKTIIIGLFLLVSGCGIVKQQSNYLTNLRIPDNKLILTLKEDIPFTQIRGKIKTEYYALAGKGDYELVLESDSGMYFYAYNPVFVCEDNEIGGLFLTKENKPNLYLWTSLVINEKKFRGKISNPNFVKRLKKISNANRPFVHWYYEVGPDNYKIQ